MSGSLAASLPILEMIEDTAPIRKPSRSTSLMAATAAGKSMALTRGQDVTALVDGIKVTVRPGPSISCRLVCWVSAINYLKQSVAHLLNNARTIVGAAPDRI